MPLVTATSDAVKPVTASLNVKVAMKAPLSVAGTPLIVTVGRIVSTVKAAVAAPPSLPTVS